MCVCIYILYIYISGISLSYLLHLYRQTDRQTDSQTDRQTDRQTHRQTDIYIDR